MHKQILFLTLKVFSATGGIEKVCRVAGKALYERTLFNYSTLEIFCMHDNQVDADDNKYFPTELFRGFGGNRIWFIIKSLQRGKKSNVVILSHINLLVVGWLIKKLYPSTKLVLFAHGIEVWHAVSSAKKKMMNLCDEIICVSNFTADRIQEVHHIPKEKCKLLNNCLDPFLPLQAAVHKDEDLRQRYGFKATDKILFTLTRLSAKERYKGYDKVMEALVSLKEQYPNIRYLLAGSYDYEEKKYLDDIIVKLNLTENVVMAGFIPEVELAAHFFMADIYVMPSLKEGFGIVFIEAMYYGLPVIAGNKDGSVDALDNGKLGLLVDPLDTDAIKVAIGRILNDKKAFIPNRDMLMQKSGYTVYKKNLDRLLEFV